MASSRLTTWGSCSYRTSTAQSASSASRSDGAASARTASPWYRTSFLSASSKTTPGIFLSFDVSTETILAWA